MNLAEIEVNDFGGSPVAEHNYPCPVYWRSQKAVYHLNTGIFHPSHAAHEFGWRLIRADNWLQRLVLRLFSENPRRYF